MDVIELESTPRVVRVRFMGVIYRRYPLAKQSSDRNYFRAGRGDVYKGRSYLHRDLWIAQHGPIPDGYEVDHRDGNPLNNDVSNLQLLTIDEHREKSYPGWCESAKCRWDAMPPERRQAMWDAAAEWHRSDAGREWHRHHGRNVAAAMPHVDRTCDRCGAVYCVKENVSKWGKFCSNKCRAAARRDSGIDNENRTCGRCGGVFSVNRYSKQQYCSRKCGWAIPASRQCNHCGKPFPCSPKKVRQFCSMPCAYANRTRRPATGLQPNG